mgnify:CR=1 FL=1|jgi:hypothetical protein
MPQQNKNLFDAIREMRAKSGEQEERPFIAAIGEYARLTREVKKAKQRMHELERLGREKEATEMAHKILGLAQQKSDYNRNVLYKTKMDSDMMEWVPWMAGTEAEFDKLTGPATSPDKPPDKTEHKIRPHDNRMFRDFADEDTWLDPSARNERIGRIGPNAFEGWDERRPGTDWDDEASKIKAFSEMDRREALAAERAFTDPGDPTTFLRDYKSKEHYQMQRAYVKRYLDEKDYKDLFSVPESELPPRSHKEEVEPQRRGESDEDFASRKLRWDQAVYDVIRSRQTDRTSPGDYPKTAGQFDRSVLHLLKQIDAGEIEAEPHIFKEGTEKTRFGWAGLKHGGHHSKGPHEDDRDHASRTFGVHTGVGYYAPNTRLAGGSWNFYPIKGHADPEVAATYEPSKQRLDYESAIAGDVDPHLVHSGQVYSKDQTEEDVYGHEELGSRYSGGIDPSTRGPQRTWDPFMGGGIPAGWTSKPDADGPPVQPARHIKTGTLSGIWVHDAGGEKGGIRRKDPKKQLYSASEMVKHTISALEAGGVTTGDYVGPWSWTGYEDYPGKGPGDIDGVYNYRDGAHTYTNQPLVRPSMGGSDALPDKPGGRGWMNYGINVSDYFKSVPDQKRPPGMLEQLVSGAAQGPMEKEYSGTFKGAQQGIVGPQPPPKPANANTFGPVPPPFTPSKTTPQHEFVSMWPEKIKPDPWTGAAPREVTDKLRSMDPRILEKVRENPQLRSIFNLEE